MENKLTARFDAPLFEANIESVPRLLLPQLRKAKLYPFAFLIESSIPLIIPLSAIRKVELADWGSEKAITVRYAERGTEKEVRFSARNVLKVDRHGTKLLYEHLQSALAQYSSKNAKSKENTPGRRALLMNLALHRDDNPAIDILLDELNKLATPADQRTFLTRSDLPAWGTLLIFMSLVSPLFTDGLDAIWSTIAFILGFLLFFFRGRAFYALLCLALTWSGIGNTLIGDQWIAFGVAEAAIAGLVLIRYRAVKRTEDDLVTGIPKGAWGRFLPIASFVLGFFCITWFTAAVALMISVLDLPQATGPDSLQFFFSYITRTLADITIIGLGLAIASLTNGVRRNLAVTGGLFLNGSVILLFLILAVFSSGS